MTGCRSSADDILAAAALIEAVYNGDGEGADAVLAAGPERVARAVAELFAALVEHSGGGVLDICAGVRDRALPGRAAG